MPIIGIDLGAKRIGIATSDSGEIATPHSVLRNEGDVVANRYRIRRQAGAGGMGTVYEALDTLEGVPVALKTWRAAPDNEPRAVNRSRRIG